MHHYYPRALLFITFFVLHSFLSLAQVPTDSLRKDSAKNYVVIHNITVDGNRKTKPQVILRQLTFAEGDTIPFDELMEQIEVSKNQLLNIGLFNTVVINIKNWEGQLIDLSVSVTERWYTFPVPVIHLYDRGFNVWISEHNAQLKWIQFGIKFIQQNVRGRDEDLRITALFGFAQTFEIEYNIPYFDRAQKNGLRVLGGFYQSKNITYEDSANKEHIFQNVDQYQKQSFAGRVDLIHSPRFNYKYIFSLGYYDNSITDTIAKLNPDYFPEGQTHQQYFEAKATFARDFRDIASYPLKGSLIQISVAKSGFGLWDDVNTFSTIGIFDDYFALGKKWYLSTENKLKVSFPKLQPFNLQYGLGYREEYLSGYEYYVIDGPVYGYSKVDVKNEILKINLPTPAKSIFYNGTQVPFIIYARAFFNAGYVQNDLTKAINPLNNTFLFGGGVGLDVRLVYDTTLRIEYSVNGLGEHGFFLHAFSFF